MGGVFEGFEKLDFGWCCVLLFVLEEVAEMSLRCDQPKFEVVPGRMVLGLQGILDEFWVVQIVGN